MKFVYNQKVEVKEGFYRGQQARIKKYYPYVTMEEYDQYLVILEDGNEVTIQGSKLEGN